MCSGFLIYCDAASQLAPGVARIANIVNEDPFMHIILPAVFL
jgi:hypothetical protein